MPSSDIFYTTGTQFNNESELADLVWITRLMRELPDRRTTYFRYILQEF